MIEKILEIVLSERRTKFREIVEATGISEGNRDFNFTHKLVSEKNVKTDALS